MLLQSQLFHEASDAVADARGGLRTSFLTLGPGRCALLSAAFGALPILAVSSIGARVAVVAVYVVAFPIALARLSAAPERAATLRRLHRLSGLVVGAALFVQQL